MLDKLADFDAALAAHEAALLRGAELGARDIGSKGAVIGEMHCSRCGDSRKMEAVLLHPRKPPVLGYMMPNSMPVDAVPSNPRENLGVPGRRRSILETEPIVLCTLRCVQCNAAYTALKYPGHHGSALIMASSVAGGLATKFTPLPVAYYLDQGHKSHAIGANSAAIAMYRAALEQLLFEQGFTVGMLNQKIAGLEAAITARTAPAWANDLDMEYLKVVKDLGNGAIHTNGGDISKQDNIDSELIVRVELMFVALLQVVYEIPQKKSANLAQLRAKATLLK